MSNDSSVRLPDDAAPYLDEVTARGGVAPSRIPGSSLWLVSRYEDVRQVLADSTTFRPWGGFEWQDAPPDQDGGLPFHAAWSPPTPLPFVHPNRHAKLRRQLMEPCSPRRHTSRRDL